MLKEAGVWKAWEAKEERNRPHRAKGLEALYRWCVRRLSAWGVFSKQENSVQVRGPGYNHMKAVSVTGFMRGVLITVLFLL